MSGSRSIDSRSGRPAFAYHVIRAHATPPRSPARQAQREARQQLPLDVLSAEPHRQLLRCLVGQLECKGAVAAHERRGQAPLLDCMRQVGIRTLVQE